MKITTEFAVIIIILLMIIFTIYIFEGKVKAAYDKNLVKQICKDSVLETSKLRLRYDDFSGEIKCPTIPLKINDKNEEIVKKKIAEAMYDCWDKFGRGQEDLFADNNIYCTICHRITFDKNVKFSGFTKYIASERPSGQKITYLQFMSTERTDNSEFLKESEKQKIDDTIDASKQNEYAIIFTYIKGKEYLKEYTKKAAYTAPGAGLMALGLGLIYYSPGVGTAVSSIATPAIGIPAAGIAATLGTITFGIGSLWSYLTIIFADNPFEHIALISFIPYDSEHLKNLNCRDLPIQQS